MSLCAIRRCLIVFRRTRRRLITRRSPLASLRALLGLSFSLGVSAAVNNLTPQSMILLFSSLSLSYSTTAQPKELIPRSILKFSQPYHTSSMIIKQLSYIITFIAKPSEISGYNKGFRSFSREALLYTEYLLKSFFFHSIYYDTSS